MTDKQFLSKMSEMDRQFLMKVCKNYNVTIHLVVILNQELLNEEINNNGMIEGLKNEVSDLKEELNNKINGLENKINGIENKINSF